VLSAARPVARRRSVQPHQPVGLMDPSCCRVGGGRRGWAASGPPAAGLCPHRHWSWKLNLAAPVGGASPPPSRPPCRERQPVGCHQLRRRWLADWTASPPGMCNAYGSRGALLPDVGNISIQTGCLCHCCHLGCRVRAAACEHRCRRQGPPCGSGVGRG
jgi:hypothetical protein